MRFVLHLPCIGYRRASHTCDFFRNGWASILLRTSLIDPEGRQETQFVYWCVTVLLFVSSKCRDEDFTKGCRVTLLELCGERGFGSHKALTEILKMKT